MFIKDYMTRHPVMIDPHASIVEAQESGISGSAIFPVS